MRMRWCYSGFNRTPPLDFTPGNTGTQWYAQLHPELLHLQQIRSTRVAARLASYPEVAGRQASNGFRSLRTAFPN
jgi:hypothetical protein